MRECRQNNLQRLVNEDMILHQLTICETLTDVFTGVKLDVLLLFWYYSTNFNEV